MRKLADLERERALNDERTLEVTTEPKAKNYITPCGYARLKAELTQLLDTERPDLVKVISWAAGNGDRSENGDYIYGKRRLREIDHRIRFLGQRLDTAVVVDPARPAVDQIFFGATVTYQDSAGTRRTVSIVGEDEVDTKRGHVSWISPVARALAKARIGEIVHMRTPSGSDELEILEIRYVRLPE